MKKRNSEEEKLSEEELVAQKSMKTFRCNG